MSPDKNKVRIARDCSRLRGFLSADYVDFIFFVYSLIMSLLLFLYIIRFYFI